MYVATRPRRTFLLYMIGWRTAETGYAPRVGEIEMQMQGWNGDCIIAVGFADDLELGWLLMESRASRWAVA